MLRDIPRLAFGFDIDKLRMAEERSRSASPAREEPKPKKPKSAGFKWKDKSAAKDEGFPKKSDVGPLEREYRDRSPRRVSYRDNERSKRGAMDKDHTQAPRRLTDDPPAWDLSTATTDIKPNDAVPEKSKEKKRKKSSRPPPSLEPMIIVNINDRLGTKAAIPCLASDSIKAFKAVVAAHIGRQPHEIMLKRQGERPFKDQLSLEDYGVSNGVQLDLELDTGD